MLRLLISVCVCVVAIRARGIMVLASFSSGLGLLVSWLSDPDNLNQLVVSQLLCFEFIKHLQHHIAAEMISLSLN